MLVVVAMLIGTFCAVINGERAALASPTFRTKLMTTKKTFLKSLADKYIKN